MTRFQASLNEFSQHADPIKSKMEQHFIPHYCFTNVYNLKHFQIAAQLPLTVMSGDRTERLAFQHPGCRWGVTQFGRPATRLRGFLGAGPEGLIAGLVPKSLKFPGPPEEPRFQTGIWFLPDKGQRHLEYHLL